ncbi:MAG: EamA family transporter, partial [Campylobacter sp.]|nr:EamA family transporter [Campylobacter sp.]
FIGIALVVQPNIGITANDLIGIGGGICMGMAITSVRELRKYYSANMIILSFMFFGVLTMSILMILGEFGIGEFKFVFPNLFGWVLIALVGLSGYYYQVYLTKSYAATKKAGIPAAISYMDIIFSMILGLLLGDALPNNVALLGIATIIFSGLLIAKEK